MKLILKYTFLLTLLILIISCDNYRSKENHDSQALNSTPCDKSIKWGDLDICFPKIGGMKECITHAKIEKLMKEVDNDQFTYLAYFLNDTIYSKLDAESIEGWDDYFLIYVVNSLKNQKINESELDYLSNKMTESFNKTNWIEIDEKIKTFVKNKSIDRPLLLETYKMSETTRTSVSISNINNGRRENVLIITTNILLIKNRIIFLAYYMHYNGLDSIKIAKAKNDYILLSFLDVNK